MPDWTTISKKIAAESGTSFNPGTPISQTGGCINTAVTLTDGNTSWFIKLNASSKLAMFDAEAAGLKTLAECDCIQVPLPLCTGISEHNSYIVLQHLALERGSSSGHALAGSQLAALHQCIHSHFGWTRENTIGATPQHNRQTGNWIDFWREQRLGFQLQLAAKNDYIGSLQTNGERLLADFGSLIDHDPQASLLHGDLWGGNLGFTADDQPVIFDPAVYYGDREAELAMTELFGGFSSDFYAAYNDRWPLDSGYRIRKDLYTLYHILNHLNLFGTGYLGQAQQLIKKLLAEIE